MSRETQFNFLRNVTERMTGFFHVFRKKILKIFLNLL